MEQQAEVVRKLTDEEKALFAPEVARMEQMRSQIQSIEAQIAGANDVIGRMIRALTGRSDLILDCDSGNLVARVRVVESVPVDLTPPEV